MRVATASIGRLDAGDGTVGSMGNPPCLPVVGPGSLLASSVATLCTACILVPPATGPLVELPTLWSHSAVLLSALPIGSGPFTIAKLYGLEAGMTSGAILASHLVSIVTVSALVAWLG